ncbi:MAG: Smr/MutS family protein [Bacteroidota bacterium]
MNRGFKVGQRVRFLHEQGEGIVQRILSNNRLEVLVDDFLELEMGTDEVVHIHAQEEILRRPDEEDEPAAKVLIPQVSDRQPPSLVLARNADRDYELWLLNPGGSEMHFNVFLKTRNKYRGLNSAICAPRDKFFIAKISTQDFHNAQQIYVQVLPFPIGEFVKPVPPFVLQISIKTQVFNRKAESVPELGLEGYEFILEETADPLLEAIDRASTQDSNFRITRKGKGGGASAPQVVDLHIEKLVDNPARLNSPTMLNIQLEHFERKLTDANLHHARSIVFIHGVGSGKLKREMKQRLAEYDFVSHFRAADPVLYGNGATVVHFKGH